MQDTDNAPPLVVKKGTIIYQDVTFSYAHKKIFSKIDLTIPGGQKVGLVGFSGAGKTTFVNLLMRLYDIQKGDIMIDGQSIQKVTQHSIHQNIAFIPQDAVLFHRSLYENIVYGRLEASKEEVLEVARWSGCLDFANDMPEGLDTIAGERGARLSGGQRQRIAIARAMLKNAPILIMDEATSALDSLTEEWVQQHLYEIMQHKTALVIAHRLSTLRSMDRILVFDQGVIVEDGPVETLLQQKGKFAELWNMQMGGFLTQQPLPSSSPLSF